MKQRLLVSFDSYVSPFSWRYASVEMKRIWSEENKYKIWRKIWVAFARAQQKAGLVTNAELEDLVKHRDEIDIARIMEIEKKTRHDVVAAIREFAEKAKIGGGKIHLGATSMDIVDNADMLRMKAALKLVEEILVALLKLFAGHIEAYADFPCIGYTHLQPAEPTTVGYRLAFYAQDLLTDLSYLRFVQREVKGKGMKGAVGTRASYQEILKGTNMSAEDLDRDVSSELNEWVARGGGPPSSARSDSDVGRGRKRDRTRSLGGMYDVAEITSQVYPRIYDYLVLSVLASIASSVAKFAGDLRILQSPAFGEWSEPFGKKQVGSSAMPFKKNPINSEKICSLARFIAQIPAIALENATLSHLERTLDDSANKRVIVPEGFLALDEILNTAKKIVEGLVINVQRTTYNLQLYAPFAATETILITLVKRGANRQTMHDILRDISMNAWESIQSGKPNPMSELLSNSKEIKQYLSQAEVKKLLDVTTHIGDAPKRALKLVRKIHNAVHESNRPSKTKSKLV